MVKVTSADGTSIAAWRSGDGPPLVMVHGAGASHTTFRLAVPLLAKHFTVYALDRRGRGASGDAENYALEREFEDIAAMIDSLDEPVNVFGHSLGALCAAEAARLTKNVRRLALYEGGPKPPVATVPTELVERLERLLAEGQREALWVTFLAEGVNMPPSEIEWARSQPTWQERVGDAHTLVRELRAFNQHGSDFERFKRLEVPTLLMLGGDSPPRRHEAARAWGQLFPRSETVVLAGQQHIAHQTAPEQLAGAVQAFLERE